MIKIQIFYLGSLQRVKILDLTNLQKNLNFKILEFEINFEPIKF